MGVMPHLYMPLGGPAFAGYAVAEDSAEYRASSGASLPESFNGGNTSSDDKDVATREQCTADACQPPLTESTSETLAGRISDGNKLRLAMALVEGLQSVSGDRAANTSVLRLRLARAAGQESAPESADELRSRLKSLARAVDRNLAEQLHLLVRFDEQQLYQREGCRSMLVWMGIHLKLGRVAAFERLRVGRALSQLPMLSSLFALGHVSFSQLREVTRYATTASDSEFAIAVLELSVSETIEYCRRFRHVSDANEDAAVSNAEGQEKADALAALRAYERRALSVREIDAHNTRITLDLPNDLAAEFLRSLEHAEDWIREGGEDGESVDKPSDQAQGQPDRNGLNELNDSRCSDQQEPVPDHADTSTTTSTNTTTATPIATPTATQIRADAAVLMSRRSLAHAGEAVAMADRYRVHIDVGAQQLLYGPNGIHGFEPFDASESTHPVQRPQLRGVGPVSHATARRIAAEAGFTLIAADSDGDVVGTRKQAAPFSKQQLRAIAARDRRCQVPGCGATRHLHGHHVVHRENGGRSDMDNAAMVCSSCHRLLHEGGFRLERIGPNGAALSPLASALEARTTEKQRTAARARIDALRRFRLYGPDGKEHGSIGAALNNSEIRTLLLPNKRPPDVQLPNVQLHNVQLPNAQQQPGQLPPVPTCSAATIARASTPVPTRSTATPPPSGSNCLHEETPSPHTGMHSENGRESVDELGKRIRQ